MVTHDKYVRSPLRAYRQNVLNLDDANTTVKVALMQSSFTINRETDEVWSNIEVDEIDPATNSGYTEGGQELANKNLFQDTTDVVFDGDDIVWGSSSINAYYAVVYIEDTTSTANETLLSVVDFEGEEISSNGDFVIEWDANGIFRAIV